MLRPQLASCVMVTNGRSELVRRSIRCYLAQTYTKRELIILSQGNDEFNDSILECVAGLGREDIFFYHVASFLTLGEMRNLSVELARGELICQWDDDDIYHPLRLANQVRAAAGGVASAYRQHLKYFVPDGTLFWIDWSVEPDPLRQLLCGAVVFHRRCFDQYKGLLYPRSGLQSRHEEDLNALEKLRAVW